jgi:hypothetical protein
VYVCAQEVMGVVADTALTLSIVNITRKAAVAILNRRVGAAVSHKTQERSFVLYLGKK